jgi:hypothetical protein
MLKKITLCCGFLVLIVIAFNQIQGKRRFFVRTIGTTLGWEERLYTPTHIDKIGGLYFIVDCWHNRVLYNPTLEQSLSNWKILDDDLAGPHSITTNGTLFLIEDTGRNSLCVYHAFQNRFTFLQRIDSLGLRTHRARYDSLTEAFYVLSSNSQEITKLRVDGDRLGIEYRKSLPFLEHSYTRSFSLLDGHMLFISGPGRITETEYKDDSYRVLATYDVPPKFREMNDLARIGNYFYLTATPQSILRTKSLADLQRGEYEDLYQKLGLKGTPYYMSVFDGKVYLPQIEEYSGIISFDVKSDSISDVETIFDFGSATWIDDQVRRSLPK